MFYPIPLEMVKNCHASRVNAITRMDLRCRREYTVIDHKITTLCGY